MFSEIMNSTKFGQTKVFNSEDVSIFNIIFNINKTSGKESNLASAGKVITIKAKNLWQHSH